MNELTAWVIWAVTAAVGLVVAIPINMSPYSKRFVHTYFVVYAVWVAPVLIRALLMVLAS
jgi:hypothetical protein